MNPKTERIVYEHDDYIFTDDLSLALQRYDEATHVALKFLKDPIYGAGISETLQLIDEFGLDARFARWHFNPEITGIAVILPASHPHLVQLLRQGVIQRWDLLRDGKILVECDHGNEFILWRQPKEPTMPTSQSSETSFDDLKTLGEAIVAGLEIPPSSPGECDQEIINAYRRLEARAC